MEHSSDMSLESSDDIRSELDELCENIQKSNDTPHKHNEYTTGIYTFIKQ